MASTNQTTNFGLPIYTTGDRASWTDTNAGFSAIDTAVKKAVDDSADAISGVATVTQTANTALGTANSASADASTALTGLDTKQDKTDNNLNTTTKTVVGAINEVANEVSGKQNATDNNLDTTDKTIVGAINENKSNIDKLEWKTATLSSTYLHQDATIKYNDIGLCEIYINGLANLTTNTYTTIGTLPTEVPKPSIDLAFDMFDGANKEYRLIVRTTGELLVFPYFDVVGQANVNGLMLYF